MNRWTELSIEFANQRNYLDELFKVYPTIPEGIRDIGKDKWEEIERAFEKKDKMKLLELLLALNLFMREFPIWKGGGDSKDSRERVGRSPHKGRPPL